MTSQLSEPEVERATSATTAAALVSSITKRVGRRVVIDGVDFEIGRGKFLAVFGDNSAGKTSLFNIIAGADIADQGTVAVIDRNGDRLALESGDRRAAIRAGIGMLGRDRTLAGGLTALQNIMLGRQSFWRVRFSRWDARARIAELMQRLSIRFPLDVPVAELTAGDRLRIEVVRALYAGVDILLLDEPTADLTQQESKALFQGLRLLVADGLAIVFATSKLAEAFEFADRMLVLRDGRKIAELPTAGQDRSAVAAMMIGRVITKAQLSFRASGKPLIEFHKVAARGADARASLKEASFELRRGEVLGIAGIAGNGQATLVAIASGLARPYSGEVRLYGRQLRRFDAGAFVRAGVGRIPAGCAGTAIVPEMTIEENIAIEDFQEDWFHRYGVLRRSGISTRAGELIKNYDLDCSAPRTPCADLPAATVRKLIFARVLDRGPQLILASDPTHGLDAASAEMIHRWLIEARDDGAGILLISDDVDELLMLADSIAVLHHGHLTLPQPTGAFDAGSLGHMMGGHGSLALDWVGWGDT